MAYDPTAGDLHPELTQYKPPDALQDWTAETAGAIQDHVTTQTIADQSQEARSQFINGVASSKDDLVGMVRDDPTSAPLAFKLIDNFPLDGVQDHFRNQVAVAAVQGYAAHDRDAAHAAVDKYSDYLGDGEADALKQHADQLDFIRQTDAAGQAVHQRQMMQRLSDASAGGYLSLLADPSNGSPVFPQNWGTQMMQDGSLEPAAKAGLFTAYRNLQANGDPENSDPMAVADLIKRAATGYQNPDHPSQTEIMNNVGNLKLPENQIAGHFDQATQELNLTPEEQNLYQHHLQNLNGTGKVFQPHNEISTMLQMSTEGPGDRTYNLPTVWNGKALSPDQAQEYVEKNNLWSRFPSYGSDDEAESRYQQMHQYFDQDTSDWMRANPVRDQLKPGLSLGDAQFISERLGPQSQATRAQTQQLSDALDTARDQIGNPQAYSRFVNWFMPQARNGGNFDPGSKDYLLTPERMDRFMPTGDDVIMPAIQAAVAAKQRPPLGQIFAGGWTPPVGPAQPEKQFPAGPQGREDDNPKAPPIKIPGGGSRPF